MLKKSEERALFALGFLPSAMSNEIKGLCASMGGAAFLREIRVRREGRASVKIGRSKIPLKYTATASEADEIIKRLTGGALYAHRDEIANGFISVGHGIRVGVVGTAGYEGGRLVGVSDISSFLFRIPTGECAFADRLYSVYQSSVRSGMLIYSPPGAGKTTALRSLAARLGGGRNPLSVVAVDERREFYSEDYRGAEVDVLVGYPKRVGIEIATRTMNPDVILIDEIGAGEAESVGLALMSGVPVVATAHGGSFSDVCARRALLPLIESGVFDVFVGISENERGYSLTVDRR